MLFGVIYFCFQKNEMSHVYEKDGRQEKAAVSNGRTEEAVYFRS